MRTFRAGTKLALLTRHQDTRRFVPDRAIGEVLEGNDGHPHKMIVRVYHRDWHPKKGIATNFSEFLT